LGETVNWKVTPPNPVSFQSLISMNIVYTPGEVSSKAVIVKTAVLLSLGAKSTGFDSKFASKVFVALGNLHVQTKA